MNCEYVETGKDVGWAFLKVLSQNSFENIEQNYEEIRSGEWDYENDSTNITDSPS
jgi:hypothetical protein